MGFESFLGTSVEVPIGVLMLLFLMIALPTGEVISLAQAGARRLKAQGATPAPASTDSERETDQQK